VSGDPRPIGVFDSGVGGLTVLRALHARLPRESTIYLGDTARVPYGTKSSAVVTRYSLKNAEFLVERDIKLLVVACNTATAAALPALEQSLSIPVVGVIAPGAHAAAAVAPPSGHVAVIGTPGTIKSGAYSHALRALRPDVEVLGRACPLFVPLAEEGWTSGEVPRLVAERYLGDLRGKVDALVLGCTHYPLLKTVIAEVMGPGTTLVDSAEATAAEVAGVLARAGLLAPESSPAPHHGFYVTDVPERFVAVGAQFLGRPLSGAEQVDISFP
jgi:glutamate racemase